MSMKKISEAILGVGVDDTTIDLFESQYPAPTGVSYNSYVILDEKTTILDTVDARATEPWLENLDRGTGQAASPPIWLSPTWSRTTVPTWQSWRHSTLRCRWWATPRPFCIWNSSLALMPLPRSAV